MSVAGLDNHCHPEFPTSYFHVEQWLAAQSEQDSPLLEEVSGSVCLFRLRGLAGSLPSLFDRPRCEEECCFVAAILEAIVEG